MEILSSLSLVGLIAFAFFVLIFAWLMARMLYKKAGPDEALIVYGRRKIFKPVREEKGDVQGFRIVRGAGTFVFPVAENYKVLSLRMMTLDIDLQHVYTSQGIPINVKAVAQVKIHGDVDLFLDGGLLEGEALLGFGDLGVHLEALLFLLLAGGLLLDLGLAIGEGGGDTGVLERFLDLGLSERVQVALGVLDLLEHEGLELEAHALEIEVGLLADALLEALLVLV